MQKIAAVHLAPKCGSRPVSSHRSFVRYVSVDSQPITDLPNYAAMARENAMGGDLGLKLGRVNTNA